MYAPFEETDKDLNKEKNVENEQTKLKMQLLKSKLNKKNTTAKSSATTLATLNLNDANPDNLPSSTKPIQSKPPSALKLNKNNLLENLRLKRYNTLNFDLSNETSQATSNNNPNKGINTINESDVLSGKTNAWTAYACRQLFVFQMFVSLEVTSTIKQMKHFETTSKPAVDYDDEIDDEDDNEDDEEYDQNDEDEDDEEDEIETQSLYNPKSALISATGADSNFDAYASPDLLENEKILLKLGKKLSDMGGTAGNSGPLMLRNKTYSNNSTASGKIPPYYYISQSGVNRSAIYNHQSKYMSSADSLLSRNNTSSKLLKSTISLNKQSSIDDLASMASSNGKKPEGLSKLAKQHSIETSNKHSGDIKSPLNDEPSVSGDDDTLSLLQKQINFIMTHGAFVGDEDNSNSLKEKDQATNENQKTETVHDQNATKLKHINANTYKKFPPKFQTLYNSKWEQ